jgi:hypothetical protein
MTAPKTIGGRRMNDIRPGNTGEQERDGGITEAVSEQAGRAAESGRRELRVQLDERTTQVGRTTRSFADALRRSGQSMQSRGADEVEISKLTSGVADRLERAGGYLERVQGEQMLRDAERFVRARPWLVTSAAAAAGLVASRIFKASSESRYAESSTTAPTVPGYGRYQDTTAAVREPDRGARESAPAAGRSY